MKVLAVLKMFNRITFQRKIATSMVIEAGYKKSFIENLLPGAPEKESRLYKQRSQNINVIT